MGTARNTAVLMVALWAGAASAADAGRQSIDIKPQPIKLALRDLGEQTGIQIVFRAEDVAGADVTTPRVAGALSPQEALEKMLQGAPGLKYEWVNSHTVMISARKRGEASSSAAGRADGVGPMRLAQENPQDVRRPGEARAQASADDEIQVRDTRYGRQVQGVIPRGENEAVYFEVIDREEIEKYGVNSLDELLRRLPQVSNYGTAEQAAVRNIAVGSGGPGLQLSLSTINLRGAGATRTAVLLNGRRMTRSSATGGIDISRVPLASIERIEILPASASAIYGGGSIGGAINIITRSQYSGRDLTLDFGTTTGGGADNVQATYIQGWSVNDGKTSGTITLNASRQDELRASQRDFIQRALDRIRPDSGLIDGAGRSVYESVMIPAFRGMPGTLVLNSSAGGLGIPGNPDARYAGIPPGQDGTELTPQSFTATAGAANLGMRIGRSMLINPSEKASASFSLEHQFIDDRLSLYVDAMADAGRYTLSYPSSVSALSLSATDARNPFRTDVTPGFVGRAVTLYYDPVELEDSYARDEKVSGHLVVGLKGKLSGHWNWAWDLSGDRIKSRTYSRNSVTSASSVVNARIYNPLADHTAFPLSQADVEAYFPQESSLISPKYSLASNAQLDGRVLALPAGDLRASFGGEINWWVNESGKVVNTYAPSLASLLNRPEVSVTPAGQDLIRRLTTAVQGEVRIPIFSERWHPAPWMRTLELVGSTRLEEVTPKRSSFLNYSDVDPKRATTSAIALKFAPVRDVALRLGFTQGFLQQDDIYLNENPNPNVFDIPWLLADPLRGNVLTTIEAPTLWAGNAALAPETSESKSAGLILTPAALPGLTVTVDYYLTTRVGTVIEPDPQHMLDYPELYPGRVQRGEPSAEDLANGWAGPITLLDLRYVNAGKSKTEGVDTQIRYEFDAARAGSFSLSANAGWINDIRTQPLVGQPTLNSADAAPRWKGRGYVAWMKGSVGMNINARYTGHYSTDTTAPTNSIPLTIPYDGRHIGSSLLWDWQVTYQMPARAAGVFAGLLADTQWRLSVLNLFDREPPFRTDFTGAFYSRYDDIRQRTVSLQLRKSF